MAEFQPNRFDKRAMFVGNYGGFIGYERFVYKDLLSVKLMQGLFADCSAGWASVTHIGIGGLMFERDRWKGYLGFGPVFMIRESWNRFGDAYESSGYFKEDSHPRLGEIQYKLIPYGLELEFDYSLSEKDHLSLSFTPGIPMAMIFSLGWKHWFSKANFQYDRLTRPKK